MPKICSITKGHRKLVLSVASLLIIMCSYLVYLQCSFRYTIRIFNDEVEQWEGWSIKYTLDELSREYPEFLPFVYSGDSCLQTEHRRIGEGDTILWEDGDGVYSFDEIYRKKCIANYFHHLPSNNDMPQPYLRIDRKGYLKPDVGDNLCTGVYYINKWRVARYLNGQIAHTKGFAPFSFFIEIQKDGWRIAGYDLCKRDIISLDEGDNCQKITCPQHISPLLEFNKKYKVQKKLGHQIETIISVGKN